MAWTQADLDLLSAAIVGGVQEVVYADGRKVRYQSLVDMRALRNDMKQEIAAASPAPRLRTTLGRIIRG